MNVMNIIASVCHVKKTSLRNVSLAVLGTVSYYTVFQGFYNMVAYRTLVPYQNFSEFALSVTLNFIPILVIILFNALVVFRKNHIANIRLKIATDVLFSIVGTFTVNEVFMLTMQLPVDWAGTIFNTIIILLILEVIYYVHNFNKIRQQVEDQRRLALQYQYDALKAQVNPHFLFNSLNILYSLLNIDLEKSKSFVLSLSSMYRYIMSQQECETVPLKMEMDFLQKYIDILGIRYYNQFEVIINADDKIASHEIIPFTMQLLIENVTKHNIISQKHHLCVTIDIGDQYITVSNPIIPRHSESVSHIGLNYITRLYARYGKNFHIENDGKTFKAIVPYIS